MTDVLANDCRGFRSSLFKCTNKFFSIIFDIGIFFLRLF